MTFYTVLSSQRSSKFMYWGPGYPQVRHLWISAAVNAGLVQPPSLTTAHLQLGAEALWSLDLFKGNFRFSPKTRSCYELLRVSFWKPQTNACGFCVLWNSSSQVWGRQNLCTVFEYPGMPPPSIMRAHSTCFPVFVLSSEQPSEVGWLDE